jgi:hypothetical protein
MFNHAVGQVVLCFEIQMALVPYTPKRAPRKGQLTTRKVPEQVKQYVKSQFTRALELNFYDKSGSFGAAPTLQPGVMNLIPVANREGECVNFENVRFAYSLYDGSSTPVYTVNARVIVFEWKALRLPISTDILELTGASQVVNSPYRFTMRQFYRILYDKKVQINPSCAVGKTDVVDFKLKGKKVRFDDGVVPPETLGLLYYWVLSDDATVNQPLFNFTIRTTYTDA